MLTISRWHLQIALCPMPTLYWKSHLNWIMSYITDRTTYVNINSLFKWNPSKTDDRGGGVWIRYCRWNSKHQYVCESHLNFERCFTRCICITGESLVEHPYFCFISKPIGSTSNYSWKVLWSIGSKSYEGI